MNMSRGVNRPQWIAKVVAEDGEEHLLRVFYTFVELGNGFRERLINRLVESVKSSMSADFSSPHFPRPQSEHTGPEGAVLGHNLRDGKSALGPFRPVLLGCRQFGFVRIRSMPFRLL
jgi:hypothetical protein